MPFKRAIRYCIYHLIKTFESILVRRYNTTSSLSLNNKVLKFLDKWLAYLENRLNTTTVTIEKVYMGENTITPTETTKLKRKNFKKLLQIKREKKMIKRKKDINIKRQRNWKLKQKNPKLRNYLERKRIIGMNHRQVQTQNLPNHQYWKELPSQMIKRKKRSPQILLYQQQQLEMNYLLQQNSPMFWANLEEFLTFKHHNQSQTSLKNNSPLQLKTLPRRQSGRKIR